MTDLERQQQVDKKIGVRGVRRGDKRTDRGALRYIRKVGHHSLMLAECGCENQGNAGGVCGLCGGAQLTVLELIRL